jgi:hypothetical protein
MIGINKNYPMYIISFGCLWLLTTARASHLAVAVAVVIIVG